MRLTVLLIILAILGLSAPCYAQPRVTMQVQSMPVKDFLTLLKKETGVPFIYNMASLKNSRPVTLRVKDAPLKQVLDMALKQQGLDYQLENGYIVIRDKNSRNNQLGDEPAADTTQVVQGRVTDEQGAPVMATIHVKGTPRYVTTNDYGHFTLPGVKPEDVLLITGIHILPREVKPGSKSPLVIVTQLKVTELDSVSVSFKTGYQYIPRERATGSYVHLDNKSINRTTSTDILSRIQGLASGVEVLTSANDFGSRNISIAIRGISTISANAAPLIIFDNFPFEGDIKSINPNDIEDITILKDAAAASIWGARSGNGVIVITSKKGALNQPARLSVTSNLSISPRPNLHNMPSLTAADYINMEAFLFRQGYYQQLIDNPSMPALTPAVETFIKAANGSVSSQDSARIINNLKTTDVRDQLSQCMYQPSAVQQYAVNVSGGSANQYYFMSAGYDKNTGNQVNNSYNRITVDGSNTFLLLHNHLEVTSTLWYAHSATQSNTDAIKTGIYPYTRLADENGTPLPVSVYRQGYIDTIGNGRLPDWHYYPLNELQFKDNHNIIKTLRLGVDIKYKIIPGIDFSVKYLYENGNRNFDLYHPLESYYTRDFINTYSSINYATGQVTYAVPRGGILDYEYQKYTAHNARAQLGLNFATAPGHRLTAIGGAEIRENKASGMSDRLFGYDKSTGSSIPADLLNTFPTLPSGAFLTIPNNRNFTGSSDRNVSVYANAAYNIYHKYTISASARKDGSNQLGTSANNKWSPLWSAGVSWELSKEKFYTIRQLPYLKAKATFGYQGNVDKSIAALLTTSYLAPNRWQQQTMVIRNVPNPDLRWENTSMANFGIEFTSAENIVSGSIEYYVKKGIDLMGTDYLPPSAGQNSYKTNVANMKGSGWDVVINTRNIRGKISWSTLFQFSYNTDKITNYQNQSSTLIAWISGDKALVGYPVASYFALDFAGLDGKTGDPLGRLNGQKSNNYNALLNSTDISNLKYMGRYRPFYFGNTINTIKIGGVEFSFNIIYKFGHVFKRTTVNYSTLITRQNLGHSDYAKRWQQPGDEAHTNVPSFTYPTDVNRDAFYNYSSALKEKADLIRLQDIRLSYEFPHRGITAAFQQLSIYAVAGNMGLLWTANKAGLDPEYPENNQLTRPAKQFSFGIKATF